MTDPSTAGGAFSFDDYLSPFTWRYGSPEMRGIWSEHNKRAWWRRIWVAMARSQQRAGLVTPAQVADLVAHVGDIDIDRAHELEKDLHHDVMAEVHAYAEQCPVGGGIIHLGATSMDVVDNTDALRVRQSLVLIRERVAALLAAFAGQMERYADLSTMAFTHLQPAEPTTVGYRLAQYGQDLLADAENLRRLLAEQRGKGFKGAVGTAASYGELFAGRAVTLEQFEAEVMAELGLPAFPVTTQTYPRKQDFGVLNLLADIAQTIYKFAFDLRLLQSPVFGEWAEPFGRKQVGSSAMPFKRNPINSENLDSIARHLAALPRVAWDNAAHSLLERTLDDSANRRAVLPEAFLMADELLARATRLVTGLRVDEEGCRRNLARFGAFAATERLLMEAVKRGGDRQVLHEVIREHSLLAWAALREDRPNPLVDSLVADPRVRALVPEDEARAVLDASDYVGIAPQRTRALAARIRSWLQETGA